MMTIKSDCAVIAALLTVSCMPNAMSYDHSDYHSQAHHWSKQQGQRRTGVNHINSEHLNRLNRVTNDAINNNADANARIEARRTDDENNFRNHMNNGGVHNYSSDRSSNPGYTGNSSSVWERHQAHQPAHDAQSN